MSGWSHDLDESCTIAGKDWTSEVLSIPLSNSQYDRGVPGKYHACHAEKQLIAYFIHRHVFLATEVEVPSGFEDPDDFLLQELEALSLGNKWYEEVQRHCQECDDRSQARMDRIELIKLRDAAPPGNLKRILTLSSKPVCWDCRRFVESVNDTLSMRIEVRHSCTDGRCTSCL